MDYLVFLTVAPIAAFGILLTAGVVWHYKRTIQGRTLLVYLLLVAGLLIGNSSELLAPNREWTLVFGKMDHFFIQFIPVAWLAFALAYSGRSELVSLRRMWPACIVPLGTVAAVLTNDLHGLFWSEIRYFTVEDYLTFQGSFGPLFWVGGAHAYVLLIVGVVLILGNHVGGRAIYRKQSILVSFGALVPIVFNAMYVFQLVPGIRKDFTPTAFAIAGLAFFIGIYRYRLLQVVPVARANVVHNMEMAVLVFDRDHRIVDLNPAAAEIFRLTDEDLGSYGQEFPELERFIEIDRLPGPFASDVAITEDGTTRYFDVRIIPITEHEQRWIGSLVTVTDVTERTQLLNERERVVGELEETYRKLNDAHLRLIHREKLASIGQMAAGLAHELNNPLGYLKSNIRALNEIGRGLAERLPASDPVREEIGSILTDSEEAVTRMSKVVHGLLSFSHGGQAERMERYSIAEGIESALEIARSSYRDHVRIVRKLQETPYVVCNRSEINLVLLNLITNAGQAIAQAKQEMSGNDDGGTITIRTFATETTVVCEISNDIPPISSENAERVFEPFFTTKRQGEGTGLGLSIARDIVIQRHGGTLQLVDNDPPTFRVELPIDPPTGPSAD